MKQPKPIARHYHMFAGEVLFEMKHGEEVEVGSLRVNAMVTDHSKQIPVRLLGKAQQALQLRFVKQHINEEDLDKLRIIDCVILNISYLGFFTEEEFNQAPEGMKLQEKTASPGDLEKNLKGGQPN